MKTIISENLLNDPAVQRAQTYTPGPWKVEPARSPMGKPAIELEVVAGIRHIAQVRLFEDEDSANARLIAAAPELLEALKDCVEALSRLPDTEGAYRVTCLTQARAAIAKAKGQRI